MCGGGFTGLGGYGVVVSLVQASQRVVGHAPTRHFSVADSTAATCGWLVGWLSHPQLLALLLSCACVCVCVSVCV